MDQPLKCQVCGEQAAGVAASSLGAWTNAYCPECVEYRADPWADVVATVAVNGGLHKCAPWVRDVVSGTILRTERTREQFDQAVSKARRNLH